MRGALPLAAVLCAAPPRARGSVTKYELLDYDSVADPKAVVTAGAARFTVLTSRIIRMEYDAAGKWEDRPTLAFVNRKLPVPAFTATPAGGDGVTITTSHVVVKYAGGNFSAATLTAAPAKGAAAFTQWAYGMTSAGDAGNLRGTFRTLDGTKNVTLDCARNKKPHCEWGLVSRSGWALVDDTGVPCLDGDDWWADGEGKMLRNADQQDLYLFAHGHDYVGALKEYTAVGGKIPVMPRRNAGVWFTRWYDLNNADVRKIVDDYESRSLPLDVMILDMNWHKKNDWSGYSWDRTLFPYPADTMAYLHHKGLSVGANLHDATGIGTWEDTYPAVCRALGLDPDPAKKPGKKGVDFDLTNKSYVYALEDIVLKAIEDDGMDFWWIDWQQGEGGGNTGQDGPRQKMNPTIWTDKMRVTDAKRRCAIGVGCSNKRGVVNARFGGLGNHRYQHGFSGDVSGLNWQNLAYQAYFSATASNVGWGFWSHDIEGPGDDHEMYTRWIQLASYSGIMRSHDRGMSAGGCMGWPTDITKCPTIHPYNVPRYYFEANRDALRARAELIPYIYTQSRVAYDDGLGITRPMYYYHPEEAAAYPADMDNGLGQDPSTRQYYFGPDMVVAPVTAPGACGAHAPAGQPCGVANMTLWVPPGKWVERDSGAVRTGPASVARAYDLFEVPVLVRAGAVVPTAPLPAGGSVGAAGRQYAALQFTVYPGAASGSTRVYEDDGESYDYLNGSYAWTTAQYSTAEDNGRATTTFSWATQGAYPGLPARRRVTLRILSSLPPTRVTFAGSAVPYARWGDVTPGWSYDGQALATVIDLPSTGGKGSVTVEAPLADEAEFSGVRGALRRALWAKRNLDETRVTPGAHKPDAGGSPLSVAAATGDALSYLAGADPAAVPAALRNFTAAFAAALTELRAEKPDDRVAYSVALLESA